MKLIPTFIALIGFALPALAQAQPRRHIKRPNCLPIDIRVLVPKYDTNKNGKLDRRERHALHRDRRRADLKKYDKNGDGKLSKTEHADLRHGKMVSHFERLDKNRNAELTRAETRGSCTPLDHHFSQADKNSDGKVTWAEFAAAAKRHRPPHHRRGPPRGRGGHHGHGGKAPSRGPQTNP